MQPRHRPKIRLNRPLNLLIHIAIGYWLLAIGYCDRP